MASRFLGCQEYLVLKTFLEVPLGGFNVHTWISVLLGRNIGGAMGFSYLGHFIGSRDLDVSQWRIHKRIFRHSALP